jgi:4-hydroxybenzoate polyprenyltransferase
MFASVWLVVLVCALVILQVYALQLGWLWSAFYSTLFVVIPMILILKRMVKASSIGNFRELSTLIKLVMLTGILSMLFIRGYS